MAGQRVWVLVVGALGCDRGGARPAIPIANPSEPISSSIAPDAPSTIALSSTAPVGALPAVDASTPKASACSTNEDCGLTDRGTACLVGAERPYPRDRERGVFCECRAGTCELVVAGPFPCKSWRDCSWTREPHLRPVPSKEVRRPLPRPVRPCKDGEVDSVCAESDSGAKVCRIEAWKC